MANLEEPGLLLQVGVVLICIAAGWALSRLLAAMFSPTGQAQGLLRTNIGSFIRVLSPLLSVLLIAVAIPILGKWQNVALLRVALPLLFSFLLIRAMFFLSHRVLLRGGRVGSVLLAFEKIFALIVWAGVALYITGLWPDMIVMLDETKLPVGRNQASLMVILQALFSVAVTLILALWAGAVMEQRLMQLDSVHSSLRAVLARVARAGLILLAVLVSLSLVGLDLTVLSVFGGALGVGIGLGLQKLVSSYVSGFVILLERSLAIGDMVTVDRFSGMVTEIKTRYTVLRSLDGTESVVPNEMLVSGPVQNFCLTDRNLRLTTQVTVAYGTDIDLLFPELVELVKCVPRVLHDPCPVVLLQRFGADGLELDIGFWVADPENGRAGVISEVNQAIWRLFQRLDVSIPYPQREVRILNTGENLLPKEHFGSLPATKQSEDV